MTKKNFKIEAQESLDKIRQKVCSRETDFTKQELLHLEECYIEITFKTTGRTRVLDKGCSSCIITASNVVYNYIHFVEPKEIEIEKTIPVKEITTVIKEVSGDELEDFTLSELREMYPTIKDTSKKGFIQKIRQDGEV